METAIRRVVGEAEIRKGKVTLDLPPLVENGNTVPMTVTVNSPMTKTDYVKAIHVFNEKNPQANVVSMQLGPRAGKAHRVHPHPPRRNAEADRDRRDVRRHVLVGQPGGDRHARGLPGGFDLMAARALINVPKTAKRGAVIEIKTLISHVMETGFRHSTTGEAIPRDIITSFSLQV